MPPVAISPSSKYLPNWVKRAVGAGLGERIASQDSGTTLVFALCLCVLNVGCSDDIAWQEQRITLAQPTSTNCRRNATDDIIVQALGDFPPSGTTVARIDPEAGALSIDRFPTDTRYLAFETGSPEPEAGSAIALHADARSSAAFTALMLPFGRSCPSPDFEARARVGAALAALPDGSLLIAGGRNDDLGDLSDGAATSIAFVLPAGRELAEQVEGGMFLRRSGASATVLDDVVLLIGGGAHDRGPAHENYEIFDLRTRRFSANTESKLVHGPRRDHAAVALQDHSGVLVVGGVSELDRAPLASAELVTERDTTNVGELEFARTQTALHLLSDGRVLVVGGVDESGNVVREVEAFDPLTHTFTTWQPRLPNAKRALSATLVGDRIAWIACSDTGCDVSLLRVVDDELHVSAGVASLPLLSRVQAVGMADGTLLVTGQRRASDLPEAWNVDVGRNVVATVNASRAATHLRVLADRVVAEVNESGISLRRDRVTTPFDNTPATLLPDDAELALDLAAHWSRTDGLIVAQVEDARVDVAGLVFGAFDLSLRLDVPTDGQLRIVLDGDDARATIEITNTTASIDNCNVTRESGEADVTVERRGDAITVRSGGNNSRCTARLPEHLAIALVASDGVGFGALQLQRR